jgi:hypothetical protein
MREFHPAANEDIMLAAAGLALINIKRLDRYHVWLLGMEINAERPDFHEIGLVSLLIGGQ